MEQDVVNKDVQKIVGTTAMAREQEVDTLARMFNVVKPDGTPEQLDINRLRLLIHWASVSYEDVIDETIILKEVLNNIFDRITLEGVFDALIMASAAFIEREPAYGYVAARFLQAKLFREVTACSLYSNETTLVEVSYKKAFVDGITRAVELQLLDPRMLDFDLSYLADHLEIKNDDLFDYMGMRTLYERYFLSWGKKKIELPQAFWMRVAMGLCYDETNKNEKVISFYKILSTFRYVSGTPTLLHSGHMRPQLSSCFLTTVEDDLMHIFKCYSDNAQLSKWSGGVANDWSNIRATGAMIKSIKTESQGVVPFLKIANDVTAAINRSGKRRGATCVYLETWHYEIEDFLDLRRNTGDERRRAHDINTANWIPDLFMKRVLADAEWTLFSPEEVPDLHHIYGKKFEAQYIKYEEMAKEGKILLSKVVSAKQLWRKMLSRLFETGHPWITFKDPANIRNPQDHAGVIHSSNLCTEILLNTSKDETAVCNLGSINIGQHIENGIVDEVRLAETVHQAIRMLDNVIDINFYPTIEAKTANFRHRPIGLGLMGLQDALYKLDISFESDKALCFVDEIMEFIAYHAIFASSMLAKERGAYASFKGSKWDRNIFPQDTVDLLEEERGIPLEDKCPGGKLDWTPIREHVKRYGMRNSHILAIAPTATISNIASCYPCIEPIYKNIYVKANMSGEFTVVNKYLVEDLKKLGLWDNEMLELLKYYDGSVQSIPSIPDHIKEKFKEAFEIDPIWLLKLTAVRGKWIDQSQSHNVFMRGTSGKLLHDIYITAWKLGLKTTYYLRSLGATQIEKSTLDANKYGFTQKRVYDSVASEKQAENESVSEQSLIRACSIMNDNPNDPNCEVCQ